MTSFLCYVFYIHLTKYVKKQGFIRFFIDKTLLFL